MKKNFKKLSLFITAATLCCSTALFAACNKEDETTCISLADAYKQGYLSQEDLMNISYFYSGSVFTIPNEDYAGQAAENYSYDDDGNLTERSVAIDSQIYETTEISFTPTIETPVLTDGVQTKIKTAFVNGDIYKQFAEEAELSADDIKIKTYLGEYSGHYVADIALNGVDSAAVLTFYYIGGIEFINYGNGYSIYVTVSS